MGSPRARLSRARATGAALCLGATLSVLARHNSPLSRSRDRSPSLSLSQSASSLSVCIIVQRLSLVARTATAAHRAVAPSCVHAQLGGVGHACALPSSAASPNTSLSTPEHAARHGPLGRHALCLLRPRGGGAALPAFCLHAPPVASLACSPWHCASHLAVARRTYYAGAITVAAAATLAATRAAVHGCAQHHGRVSHGDPTGGLPPTAAHQTSTRSRGSRHGPLPSSSAIDRSHASSRIPTRHPRGT